MDYETAKTFRGKVGPEPDRAAASVRHFYGRGMVP